MKAKQILAAILCLILTVSVFSGCTGGGGSQAESPSTESSKESTAATEPAKAESSKDESGGVEALTEITLPLSQDTVTFKFWHNVANVLGTMKDFNESDVYIELEKRTNVHIDWIIPVHGTEQESFKLLFASNDLPDIMLNTNENGVGLVYQSGPAAAIQDGYYTDLTDLAPIYMPNYMKVVTSTPQLMKDTLIDGGIRWAISMIYKDPRPVNSGPCIREDFLKKVGMDVPETMDDWYNVLTAFKNDLGIEAPFYHFYDGMSLNNEFLAPYGVGRSFFQADGTVKYGPMEDGFKEYLDTMAKWYAEGLIDQSFSTRKADISPDQDMMCNDQIGGLNLHASFAGVNMYRSMGATNPDFNIVACPIPVKNKGDTTHLRSPDVQVLNSFVITTKCQQPEIAMQWFDYQYSEEGSFLMNYGVREGESYMYNDAGVPCWGPLVTDPQDGMSQLEARSRYTAFNAMYEDYGRVLRARDPVQLACFDTWGKDTSKADWLIPSYVTLTSDESKKYSGIMSDIETYVSENVVKFIMGTSSISFDDFRKQLESMGIQEAIQIQQAGLDRYNQR